MSVHRTRILFCTIGYRDLDDDALVSDHAFINHVTQFMDVFGLVCDNLEHINDDDNVAVRQLLILGATHASIRGFDVRYFHTLLRCCNHKWTQVIGEEYTPEMRESWKNVFEYIISKVHDGYSICMREIKNDIKLVENSHNV